MLSAATRCDLFVNLGELSAYRLGFEQRGEPPYRLDWVLTAAGAAADISREQAATQGQPPGGPALVFAALLTDERGEFAFTNVPPGVYQVRAQVPGGRAWLDAGRLLFAELDATEDSRGRLAKLDLRVAPFNKGRWKKFGALDGLRFNATGRIFITSDNALWNYAAGGLARFDGREFTTVSPEQGVAATPNSPLAARSGWGPAMAFGATAQRRAPPLSAFHRRACPRTTSLKCSRRAMAPFGGGPSVPSSVTTAGRALSLQICGDATPARM
jgi:hypothetical protein